MSDDFMGTREDAKTALIEKTRAWRETRQPSMATAKEHREQDKREHQIRFELANAAVHWLWHEEIAARAPVPSTDALVTALEFYADGKRYNGANQRKPADDPYTADDAGYMKDVTRDGGDLARRALAAFRSQQ